MGGQMGKIPVGKTLEDAYGFAFRRFFSVLGTVWLPYLVLLVVFGVFFFAFFRNFAPFWLEAAKQGGTFDQHSMDPDAVRRMMAAISGLFGLFPLLGLLLLLIHSMIAVGLLSLALGRKEGPVLAYFSLGAPVWRMVGALFLAWILIWLLAGVLAGICVAVWFAVGSVSAAGLIRALTIIIAVCVFIYAAVRLLFLLPAVVVAEERIGLGRSWECGGGNFWRMVVTAIATFLPAVIVFSILSHAIRSMMLAPLLLQQGHPTPQQVWDLFMHQGAPYFAVLLILQLIYTVVMSGLGAGMAASAYRSVTGTAAAEAHPAEAESGGMRP